MQDDVMEDGVMHDEALFTCLLRLADDHLILGQRLAEWTGHAPTLEEDLALANIALDLIGQARLLYQWAGEIEGQGRDEDALAFLRGEREYLNLQLCEQPKGDFAFTVFRGLAFGLFMRLFWEAAEQSVSARMAAIAGKAAKESAYHVRHCGEWVVRLADGTDESRRRMLAAIELATPYIGEMFESDSVTGALADAGIAPAPESLRDSFTGEINAILAEGGLDAIAVDSQISGGRRGIHSEDMGHLLAEMQYMQRAYPGLAW